MNAEVVTEDGDLLLVELPSELLQKLHVLLHVDALVETLPVNKSLLLTRCCDDGGALNVGLVAVDADVGVLVAELLLNN